MNDIIEKIGKDLFNEAKTKNVLSLAFLGDAVWTLFIRAKTVDNYRMKSGGLHKIANHYVSATSQNFIYQTLQNKDFLREDEVDYGKRARNTKFGHMAKHATDEEYRGATSFECVIGYLYVVHDTLRLEEIMEKSFEIMEKELENANRG